MDQSLSNLLEEFNLIRICDSLQAEGISTVDSFRALKTKKDLGEWADLCQRLQLSDEDKENLLKAIEKNPSDAQNTECTPPESNSHEEDPLELITKLLKTQSGVFTAKDGTLISKRETLLRLIRENASNDKITSLALCCLARIMKIYEKIAVREGEVPKDRFEICKEAVEKDPNSAIALSSFVHVHHNPDVNLWNLTYELTLPVTNQTLKKAEILFKAMEMDPKCAFPYHDFACFLDIYDKEPIEFPQDVPPNVLEIISKAIALDPDLSFCYTEAANMSRGQQVSLPDGQKATAVELACRGIELDPHDWYGYFVLATTLEQNKQTSCKLYNGVDMSVLQLYGEAIRCDSDCFEALWAAAKVMKYGDTLTLSNGRTFSNMEMWSEVMRTMPPAVPSVPREQWVWESLGNTAFVDAPQDALFNLNDGRSFTQHEVMVQVAMHCERDNEKQEWLMKAANDMKKDEVVTFWNGRRLTRLQMFAEAVALVRSETCYQPMPLILGCVARGMQRVQPNDIFEFKDGSKMNVKQLYVAAIGYDPHCCRAWTHMLYGELRDLVEEGEVIRMYDGKNWTKKDIRKRWEKFDKDFSKDHKPGCVVM